MEDVDQTSIAVAVWTSIGAFAQRASGKTPMQRCGWEGHAATVFSTILLATDGSPGAHAAVLSAAALAQKNGSRIIVVHASGVEDTPQGVRDQVSELRRAGIPARLAVVEDGEGAASAIAQMAAAWKVDVVVAGIRGAGSALRGAVPGGFVQRLVALSPCPVLAVPN